MRREHLDEPERRLLALGVGPSEKGIVDREVGEGLAGDLWVTFGGHPVGPPDERKLPMPIVVDRGLHDPGCQPKPGEGQHRAGLVPAVWVIAARAAVDQRQKELGGEARVAVLNLATGEVVWGEGQQRRLVSGTREQLGDRLAHGLGTPRSHGLLEVEGPRRQDRLEAELRRGIQGHGIAVEDESRGHRAGQLAIHHGVDEEVALDGVEHDDDDVRFSGEGRDDLGADRPWRFGADALGTRPGGRRRG